MFKFKCIQISNYFTANWAIIQYRLWTINQHTAKNTCLSSVQSEPMILISVNYGSKHFLIMLQSFPSLKMFVSSQALINNKAIFTEFYVHITLMKKVFFCLDFVFLFVCLFFLLFFLINKAICNLFTNLGLILIYLSLVDTGHNYFILNLSFLGRSPGLQNNLNVPNLLKFYEHHGENLFG